MLASVGFFVANALLVRALGSHYALSPWLLSTARFVVGLCLVALPLVPGGRAAFPALVRNPLLLVRGVLGGLGVYVYYANIEQLGAGRATFLNCTYIAMGAVLASVFLRERLRLVVIIALALGLAGVAALTGMSFDRWELSSADAYALFGALLSAIVIVVIRKLHQRENTATIFAAQCGWGLAIAAAPTVSHLALPGGFALGLLVVSGLLSGAGQLTMTASYKLLPVAEGSLYQALLPFGIALGGMAFFDERFSASEGVGAGLIIASCVLAARTRPRLAAGLPAAPAR